MTKVIAVQETQLKMLNEDYKNNIPKVSVVNEFSNGPVIPEVPQIDMETQVVNLNPQNIPSEPTVTNVNATNEVFGIQKNESELSQEAPIPFMEQTNSINSVLNEVPYKEPVVSDNIPVNVLSDDSYYELLNSLRNMITEFANNAYSAIDKFQEERLQGKATGANLVGDISTNSISSSTSVETYEPIGQPVVNSTVPNVANVVDNQTVDLDNTVVLPANFIANNISETENNLKMSA